MPAEGLGDETVPVKLAHMTGDYKRSKFLAEQVALEFARAGFPVVIVNPTAPLGDHDVKPTPTGKIVVDFLKRRHAGVHRYRAEYRRRARYRRGPLAGVRTRARGGALHSGLGESDAGGDSAQAGGDHRAHGAPPPPALCRRLVCRRPEHCLGGGERTAAARAAGRGAHGSKEDVGESPRRPRANWDFSRLRPVGRWNGRSSGSAGQA